MLLTFEKMSQLGKRHILLQRDAKIRGIPFMHLQVTMADSGEGQHPPPPYFYTKLRPEGTKKNIFVTAQTYPLTGA